MRRPRAAILQTRFFEFFDFFELSFRSQFHFAVSRSVPQRGYKAQGSFDIGHWSLVIDSSFGFRHSSFLTPLPMAQKPRCQLSIINYPLPHRRPRTAVRDDENLEAPASAFRRQQAEKFIMGNTDLHSSALTRTRPLRGESRSFVLMSVDQCSPTLRSYNVA